MLRRWLTIPTLAAFLSLTISSGRARADNAPPTAGPPAAAPGNDADLMNAQLHFQSGKDAFSAGDFTTAIREWKAAQAIKPSPKLDYNIGIAYEKLNKPRAALKYFRKYLQQMPQAPNRAEVEAKIPVLEAQAQAMPAATPEEQTAPPQQGQQPPQGQYQQPPQGQYQQGQQGQYQQGQYQQGQQGQYQYPQGQYPQGYQSPQAAQPPKKQSSHWWIVFPIVGGIILTLYLIYYLSAASSTTYYTGALSAPQGAGAGAAPDGALFRF